MAAVIHFDNRVRTEHSSLEDRIMPVDFKPSQKSELERELKKKPLAEGTALAALSYFQSVKRIDSESPTFAKPFLKAIYTFLESRASMLDQFFESGDLAKLYRFHIQAIRKVQGELEQIGCGKRMESETYTANLVYVQAHLHAYASGIAKQIFQRIKGHSWEKLRWCYQWYDNAHDATDLEEDSFHRAHRYRQRSEAAQALAKELQSGFYRNPPNNLQRSIVARDWYVISLGCREAAIGVATSIREGYGDVAHIDRFVASLKKH